MNLICKDISNTILLLSYLPFISQYYLLGVRQALLIKWHSYNKITSIKNAQIYEKKDKVWILIKTKIVVTYFSKTHTTFKKFLHSLGSNSSPLTWQSYGLTTTTVPFKGKHSSQWGSDTITCWWDNRPLSVLRTKSFVCAKIMRLT